ncbi:MAG: delta-60 repeat domain-containing protein [Candidatus Binatia bacterium]|nr:delta-60 repeat domain-containing protein [Candidatus Binatia bacterium]
MALTGFQAEIKSLVIQPDGQILAAGRFIRFGGDDILVLRANAADGSLDPSFGGGDDYPLTHLFAIDGALDIALQPDGRIVVSGFQDRDSALNDWAIVRYESNGSLDPSFDSDGIVITDMGAYGTAGDLANSLALQADGKIVVAGRGSPPCSGGALPVECATRPELRLRRQVDPQWCLR